MKRRHFAAMILGGSLAVSSPWLSERTRLARCERRAHALGSEVSLLVHHEDAAAGELAIDAGFAALEELENVLSLYRPGSQLCRLNQAGFLDRPHPDLVRVLDCALGWSRRTAGAFDPTVQPLWEIHRRRVPLSSPEFEAARARVDWARVRCDADAIRLGAGQAVTLNGIAQGFAADRVCEVLRAHGVRRALVDCGELGSLGRKPGGEAWKVGIQHPRQPDAYLALTTLDGRFLATSGDYATRFDEASVRHHIVDPATGRSPERLASVSILASSGMEADALSTAVFVLGPDIGLELVARVPGADALLALKDGTVMSTPGFPSPA